MPQAAANHAGIVPPADLVTTARRFVDAHGLHNAARKLGVGKQSLAALLAGLRVRRGTVVLVAQGLSWPGATALPVAMT